MRISNPVVIGGPLICWTVARLDVSFSGLGFAPGDDKHADMAHLVTEPTLTAVSIVSATPATPSTSLDLSPAALLDAIVGANA
jgi:hypothetical protein